MKQNFLLTFFAISIFCILSCKGQVKTEDQKIDNSKPTQSKNWEPQFMQKEEDPYFSKNNWTESKYAPAVITRNVLEDKNGDVWMATWNGIVKYDGKTFKNYTNIAQLRRFRAFCILEDSKDNLWFGTIGAGAYKYDGKEFTNFTMANGMSDDKIECITEDREGNIWFGHDLGVSKYSPNSNSEGIGEFKNYDKSHGIGDNDVHDIAIDSEGKVWIGSGGGITIFDGEKFTAFTKEDGTPFNNVRTIMEDKRGHIWFGGNDGLMRFDGQKLTNLTKDFVGCVFEDSKGFLYCSVNMGRGTGNIILARFEPSPLPVAVNTWGPEEIFSNGEMNFGISEGKNGDIWFGTLGGTYRYDGEKVHRYQE